MAASKPDRSLEAKAKIHPVIQRSIQYTLSEKEYALLHKRVFRRLPFTLRGQLPLPSVYSDSLKNENDFNAATVRASTRLFLAVQTALRLYDFVLSKISGRRHQARVVLPKVQFWKSANFRLSLSASLVLFFHRLLHRFLLRLRLNLSTKDAAPFRKRNPRVSKVLTSRLAPAIGASLAGYALAIAPKDDFRIVIAIYVATRAGEFAYNALEADGWFKNKPWWFGSWMLMPPVFGQLVHAFVFDRDTFPKAYANFIMRFTPNYVQQRPQHLPNHLAWPSQDEIIDGLANMSRLRNPSFVSPILFPDAKSTLPSSVKSISPITSSAHPAIRSMSCALLHPSEPSCLKTNVDYYMKTIPRLTRFFAIVFAIFALPRYKSILADPGKGLNRFSKSVLLSTLSVSAEIGTAWGSICLFQNLFPSKFLPTQRFFWCGFLSGFWAFLERETGRSRCLYGFRVSMESLWKLGEKKGYWKPGKTGDVWLAIAGLMLLNLIYEHNTDAVSSVLIRRGMTLARGDLGEVSAKDKESRKSNIADAKP